MSKLCITLPPLAPDYCGIASALFDLGGMIVIHDASGCTGNYLGYDEPRWFGSKQAVFCSGLRHIDAALGNDAVFIERISKAAKDIKPKFIAFLGSPVPMVIGTDYKGFARELEQATGVPCFGFDAAGMDFYSDSVNVAVNAFIDRFCDGQKPDVTEHSRRINLLGITPIDFAAKGNSGDFKKLFEENGYTINASFCMDAEFEDFTRAADVNLNVVLSHSGLGTAIYMQYKYGIPFVMGTPIGKNPYVLKKVEAFFNKTELPDLEQEAGEGQTEGGILIAGDQVISASIREELRVRGVKGRISTAVIFNSCPEYLKPWDYVTSDEASLRSLIREGGFKTLVSDPIVYGLADKSKMDSVSIPHPGVSGRLCWDTTPRYVSDEMENLIKKCM